jgi:hypothetical protein
MIFYSRVSANLMIATVLIALSPLTGCRKKVEPDLVPIILITLDTMRTDHLSVFGYNKPTPPHLASEQARPGSRPNLKGDP